MADGEKTQMIEEDAFVLAETFGKAIKRVPQGEKRLEVMYAFFDHSLFCLICGYDVGPERVCHCLNDE